MPLPSDLMSNFYHYTNNINVMFSIIRYGFLYLHCETKVSGALFDSVLNIPNEPISGGMVCFTETLPNDIREHSQRYGEFGIGVDGGWLIRVGGRKVNYVNLEGEEFVHVCRRYRSLLPSSAFGMPLFDALSSAEYGFITKLFLTQRNFCRSLKGPSELIQFLEDLDWTQTDSDIADKEWRVRNPHGYTGIHHLSKQEQARTPIGWINDPRISHHGTQGLALEIPKEFVNEILCPKSREEEVKGLLSSLGMDHVLVNILS